MTTLLSAGAATYAAPYGTVHVTLISPVSDVRASAIPAGPVEVGLPTLDGDSAAATPTPTATLAPSATTATSALCDATHARAVPMCPPEAAGEPVSGVKPLASFIRNQNVVALLCQCSREVYAARRIPRLQDPPPLCIESQVIEI